MYWPIDAISSMVCLLLFLTLSMSSLENKALVHRYYLSYHLVHLFNFLSWPFYGSFSLSYKGDNPGVYPLDEISVGDFDFEKLSHSSESLFSYFFLSSRFLWWRLLPIFPNTNIFSLCVLILSWLYVYSFCYLSFTTSHEHDTFSWPNFFLISWLNIRYFRVSCSFLVFANSTLSSVH